MALKDRTALRQREWIIMIRPYYKKDPYKMYLDTDDLYVRGSLVGSQADYVRVQGVGEGFNIGIGKDSNIEYDRGAWMVWYKTNSYQKLREQYRECLKEVPREHTRIMEIIPADIMVTPIS